MQGWVLAAAIDFERSRRTREIRADKYRAVV